MAAFPERDVIQMLLVRAAEEEQPAILGPERLATATAAALDAESDAELLQKRTAYLYLRLPRSLRNLAHAALLPEDMAFACLALATLAGLLSNYVGPSGSIHVAYNPLTILLAWNVAVLALRGFRLVRGRGAREASQPRIDGPAPSAATPSGGDAAPSGGDAAATVEAGVVPDRAASRRRAGLLSRFYVRARAWWAAFEGVRGDVEGAGRVTTAFLQSYHRVAFAIVSARLEVLLHVSAIGILAGALAGTYLRGLFFEYDAVWRSTFLTGPESVTLFLNSFLGPASLVLDGRLLSVADVLPLFGAHGAPAGPWIHRLALTLGLVVVPARVALAALSLRRANAAASGIEVDLAEPYWAERIRAVREGLGVRLREGLATTYRLEVAKLSESVARFVRERIFDRELAPVLVAFRNRGGRIRDLEEELQAVAARLQPELAAHLDASQAELQRALAASVRAILGREVQLAAEATATSVPSLPLERDLTAPLAASFGDAIGATVTAAVTAAVATVSGGLGKSLGIAIVSGLLHTSGPIGLLIGGAAALVAVGGAYALGRDKVTESIKGWSMPASVVALALRDSKIEASREATYAQVRRELDEALAPRVEDVTASILHEIPHFVAAG